MTTIAIVSEGITDQIFLEELIFNCINFEEDPEFVYAQPRRDVTQQHNAPHGGWELVFEYCSDGIIDAVETNDYTIIQIDTDCGDHVNFGLDLCPGGIDKDDATLVAETIEILRSKIDPSILDQHGEKLIFAITVHSSETWILQCIFNDFKKKNSFKRLKRKCGMSKLTKSASFYEAVAGKLTIEKCIPHLSGADSLALFISDFDAKYEKCLIIGAMPDT
jgi:hypothetical protein